MQVYDFTTLYTNFDLNEVKLALCGMAELLFNQHHKYICVGYQKSFFAKKKYRGYTCLGIKDLEEAVTFILQNTYITFGDIILKQVKGIPIGGSCSSTIADLTLCYKEFAFMKGLLREKKWGLAKLLLDNSRYVDVVGS